MSDQRMQDDRTGSTDHPQRRAGEGEGVRAPEDKSSGKSEMSVFDGKGNEVVVVTTSDDETGRRAQGTGASSEEALADAKKPGDQLGEGFGTASH